MLNPAWREKFLPRQIDVADLLLQGNTNKQIGFLLGISEKTVKAHVTQVFKILDVPSRTKAILRLQMPPFEPTGGREQHCAFCGQPLPIENKGEQTAAA